MTTTTPQTTSFNSQNSNDADCQLTIPDYSVLRQQNIDTINGYYTNLLDTYTQNYSDFSKEIASSNINSRTYADTTLKPKVVDSNTQIINLSQTMINSVNQDADLINEQKDTLSKKMLQIDSILSNIKILKDKDNEMTILNNARNDSLSSTKHSTESIQFTTYIYIGICILLVIIIIGLIIYLVYSNYSVKNANNNIYKNIATNNKNSSATTTNK